MDTITDTVDSRTASDRIPNLTIERGEGGSILLEQEWSGNVDRIELHPVHLRHLAEVAGLLPAAGADYSPPAAVLARRLRTLLDRIDRLDDMVRAAEMKGHEDLELESAFSYATWELAREFCADLEQPGGRSESASDADATRTVENRSLTVKEPSDNTRSSESRHVTPSHAAVTRDTAGPAAAGTQAKPTGNPAGSAPAQLTLEG